VSAPRPMREAEESEGRDVEREQLEYEAERAEHEADEEELKQYRDEEF